MRRRMFLRSSSIVDLSAAVVTAATQAYSGSAKTPAPIVTLNGIVIPSTEYDVAYSNNINAGTATITITGKGDYIGTAYGTFTINKAAGVAGVSGRSLTYSRNAQNLVTVSGNTGTVHYRLSTSGSWSTTIPTATNADTYTIYYYVDAADNYNAVGSSSSPYDVTTTVSKRTPVLSTSPTLVTGLTYTGSAQNLLSGGAMKHSSSDSTSVGGTFTYAQGTNAGTYSSLTWSFAPTDSTNYNSTSGSISGSVDIAKANPVYVAPTANNRTYNTSSDALLVAGSNTTPGSFTYSSSQSGTYSSTIPSQTNAGTYTTWWKFTPTDTSNYNSVSATSISTTISPKTVSNPTITLSQSTYTYNGSAKTPTPTAKDGTVTISSSEYTVSYSNNTNAGTATCTITDKSGGNYTVSGSKTFTINKASRTLSFADSYVVLNTSSNTTKTATPSAGSGDGAITYSISSTTYATINSSSGKVTSKTSDGSATVTATIAEGTNYLSATATYTLYVFATTHNYSYTGSYSNVTLPPGTYQFQVWGAQGGSNAVDSSYGITAQAGGKGGYSVGQLTISQATGVRVYVGGQGSDTAGGYNGGGNTTGSSQDGGSDNFGISKMGGGGGASDIRLSDGSLYSRMIVAGGGSGGAMCCKKVTSYTTEDISADCETSSLSLLNKKVNQSGAIVANDGYRITQPIQMHAGDKIRIKTTTFSTSILCSTTKTSITASDTLTPIYYRYDYGAVDYTYTAASDIKVVICYTGSTLSAGSFLIEYSTASVTTSTSSQVGYVGGGTTGASYSDSYKGKQNAAGTNGSFGTGASQSNTAYRYCSAAGGGGWYGGGGGMRHYNTLDTIKSMGGGSGWVNIAANAGNRPSGYTGLQLDSGTTYAGNTSFPSTSGSTETGHSGNGYARITRL